MNKKTLFIIIILSIIILISLLFLITRKPIQQQSIPETIPTPTIFQQQPTQSLQKQNGGLETEEYKKDERDFIQRTPILQKLPEKSDYFGIEYINELHLVIHAKTTEKERDYQEAKKWFVANNIDISKITIEYR